MVYLGEGEEEACAICSNNDVVWQHVSSADSVECVAKEKRLRVWRVAKKGGLSVVKYSTRARTKDAVDQIVGENQAAMLLADEGIHPLLVLPVKTIMDPDEGSFSIAPYAGVSAAKMRKEVWTDCTAQEYEQICKTFVVSLLLTQRMYGSTIHPQQGKRRYLHKDIKLLNTCYNEQFDFFPLIDYGAFSSVCQQVWVNVSDDRYLDCQMARYDAEYDEFAAETDDGMRETTGPTTDIYQTGLAAVELFLGHLPAKIDASKYRGNMRAYYQAVWEYRWDESPELLSMPAPMRSWLLKALAFDPSKRFQSAEEALLDPWLQGAMRPVLKRIIAATPGWKKLVSDLKQDLRGGRMMSSSNMGHCSSNDSSGQGGVSSMELVAEEASAHPKNAAGSFSPNPAGVHACIIGSDGSESGLDTPSEEEHHQPPSYSSDDSFATQAVDKTWYGLGATAHDVAPAVAGYTSLVTAAPYGLFEPHGFNLTSQISQLGSFPYPAAADNSGSSYSGIRCTAAALPESLSVEGSSMFSDWNLHSSLWPPGELSWGAADANSDSSIYQTRAAAAVAAAAAAAVQEPAGSTVEKADGFCSVLPAAYPTSDLVKDLQGLGWQEASCFGVYSNLNSSSFLSGSILLQPTYMTEHNSSYDDKCNQTTSTGSDTPHCSSMPARSSQAVSTGTGRLILRRFSCCCPCSGSSSNLNSFSTPVQYGSVCGNSAVGPDSLSVHASDLGLTWSVCSSGSKSALPTDSSFSRSSDDASSGSSSTSVQDLHLDSEHENCREIAINCEDHNLLVLPALPQLESDPTAAAAADNAVPHSSTYPLVVTADKNMQVVIAGQTQCEQQVHAVVQPLSDQQQQQQVQSDCATQAVAVLVAGGQISSQSDEIAGTLKMKGRRHLRFAAGVVATLLAAWQYNRHR